MKQFAYKALILLVALGLIAMLAGTLHKRFTSPSIVKTAPQRLAAAPAMPAQGGDESPIGRLMREMGEQPNNPDILVALSRALLSEGKAREAKTFLERARVMDVNNPDIPYYLGYIAQQEKDYAGALAFMEDSLKLADRAAAHFSAGILLRYFLGDTPKALEHWEKGLSSPDITQEQRDRLLAEMAKAKEQQ